jgi:hypothetical protein
MAQILFRTFAWRHICASTRRYNSTSKLTKKIFVFTGLQLYNEIVNARNGTKEERKRFPALVGKFA